MAKQSYDPTDRVRLDGSVYGRDDDYRDPYERDSDILLYSSAFRRLKGVTQVLPVVDDSARAHDRMIHSLKVAQVGKRIAQKLIKSSDTPAQHKKYILPEAVYFAGLAHDLGHPPFGHAAEKELQRILGDESSEVRADFRLGDTFEGNAQTFRTLVRLSQKSKKSQVDDSAKLGMMLTAASLIAVSKYPWAKDTYEYEIEPLKHLISDNDDDSAKKYYASKWGVYDDDLPVWRVARSLLRQEDGKFYHINAQIMDLADDITYAVHDIVDHFRSGAIPPLSAPWDDDIFKAYTQDAIKERRSSVYTVLEWENAIQWLSRLSTSIVKRYGDGRADRELLHEFESAVVRSVTAEVKLNKYGNLKIKSSTRLALEGLKQLTWYYVIDNPALSAAQMGQRRVIRQLHEWLCDWFLSCEDPQGAKEDYNLRRIPARFRDYVKDMKNTDSEIRLSISGSAYGGDAHLEGMSDADRDYLSRAGDELKEKIREKKCVISDKGFVYSRDDVVVTRPMTKKEMISRAAVDYIVSLTDDEAVKLHQNLAAINGVSTMHWLA